MHDMTRRDALRLTAGLGVAALGTAGCGGGPGSDRSSGSSEAPRPSEPTTTLAPRRELAAVAAVPDGEVLDVSPAAGEPAYLVRNGNAIRALSATCTHARCTVAWQPNSRQFQCPCHRGTYDPQGMVVSGPPPRPLDELQIVVVNGTVYLEP
jgi:Rieske Fe-S protein